MKEKLHTVSECHSAPLKYKLGTYVASGEEVMIPFCCLCESETNSVEKRLSSEQKAKNKITLLESIFPGITTMKL